MSKEMIISVNGREKKIAILDNGRVSEFYIERGEEENSGIVGNIYKGRVQRVLPGMQSAFVGIGLERDAFLYVSDFFDEEEEIERIVMEKSKQSAPEVAEREATDQIQRARLEREKQMEAVQDIAEPIAETETAIEAAISSENEAPENTAMKSFSRKADATTSGAAEMTRNGKPEKFNGTKRDFSDETIDPQKK
jgi:ribonuclease G